MSKRLIDVDKLWTNVTNNIEYCEEVLDIIDRQEVITINDVIPVKYIQRIIDECDTILKNEITRKDEETEMMIRGIKGTLTGLIEGWNNKEKNE